MKYVIIRSGKYFGSHSMIPISKIYIQFISTASHPNSDYNVNLIVGLWVCHSKLLNTQTTPSKCLIIVAVTAAVLVLVLLLRTSLKLINDADVSKMT